MANTNRILAVADAIEKGDKGITFDMGTYYSHGYDEKGQSCPRGCVAGIAIHMFSEMRFCIEHRQEGQRVLGLDDYTAMELFGGHSMNDIVTNRHGIEIINRQAKDVPDALRWMVEHEDYNWKRAFAGLALRQSMINDMLTVKAPPRVPNVSFVREVEELETA